MAIELDCKILVSDFELQSRYYVHFWTNALEKGMNHVIPPSIGLIVPLLFFYKDGFGIESPSKIDMALNKRNRNQSEDIAESF